VLGQNWAAVSALGAGERDRGVRTNQTQEMKRKERLEDQGAGEPWGGCGLSRCGHCAYGVKCFFADEAECYIQNMLKPPFSCRETVAEGRVTLIFFKNA